MANRFFILLILLCLACENSEDKARYVLQPFTASLTDMSSLNEAYREARTRLASIKSDSLREQLNGDIESQFQKCLSEIRKIEEERKIAEAQQAARELETQRQLQAQELRKRTRQCIVDLEGGMRHSPWIEGTQVLELRNSCTISVTFDLLCFSCGDSTSKTIFVTVPARGETEIGFVQGWSGNFKPGERCEAHFQGELLWNRSVPGNCR